MGPAPQLPSSYRGERQLIRRPCQPPRRQSRERRVIWASALPVATLWMCALSPALQLTQIFDVRDPLLVESWLPHVVTWPIVMLTFSLHFHILCSAAKSVQSVIAMPNEWMIHLPCHVPCGPAVLMASKCTTLSQLHDGCPAVGRHVYIKYQHTHGAELVSDQYSHVETL